MPNAIVRTAEEHRRSGEGRSKVTNKKNRIKFQRTCRKWHSQVSHSGDMQSLALENEPSEQERTTDVFEKRFLIFGIRKTRRRRSRSRGKAPKRWIKILNDRMNE